ncbi:MAG: Aldose 1-epimerase [Paracidovorax wautersii]|uniref:Aldose 1-epimerase n=1 Tax=Paracidovorax wautersii TaxID=1177982 RepID=A0A7V8FS96_9BURK|nr:MAG: Aldose 1-epimerase [Paracidovorax wautersii]
MTGTSDSLQRVQACTNTDGEPLFALRNAREMTVLVSPLGGTLRAWLAPDRYGRIADVLLGHAQRATWHGGNPHYFGALVGRWANRIAEGRFELDGAVFRVDRNEGSNLLHGGDDGFHQRVWDARIDGDTLVLALTSPEGEGGFPGTVEVEVRYRLDDDGRLAIDYQARSDAATPINLTSHPYFNLGGDGRDIGDHLLRIDAEQVLHIDERLIPTVTADVAGSAFDFRHPAPIGARLSWLEPQLALAGGFDHCYVLRGGRGALREVAWLHDPASGRSLTVETTEAGLQFYSGNNLGGVAGSHGTYRANAGLCLEAQDFPNQINSPDPALAQAVVLRPGTLYHQQTCYRLSVD